MWQTVGTQMTLPPFWGPPAEGATAPDPIIWWFAGPVIYYLLAFFVASQIAFAINWHQTGFGPSPYRNHDEKEEDS
jgi:hypothetical protein